MIDSQRIFRNLVVRTPCVDCCCDCDCCDSNDVDQRWSCNPNEMIHPRGPKHRKPRKGPSLVVASAFRENDHQSDNHERVRVNVHGYYGHWVLDGDKDYSFVLGVWIDCFLNNCSFRNDRCGYLGDNCYDEVSWKGAWEELRYCDVVGAVAEAADVAASNSVDADIAADVGFVVDNIVEKEGMDLSECSELVKGSQQLLHGTLVDSCCWQRSPDLWNPYAH